MADIQALQTLAASLPQTTLKEIVQGLRKAIQALLAQPSVSETGEPVPVDYNTVGLPHHTPAGGWLSVEEIRNTNQAMIEAISAEKWLDAFICAMQIVIMCGGAA